MAGKRLGIWETCESHANIISSVAFKLLIRQMKTKYWKITGERNRDRKTIMEAAGIIRRGGLVAFPTETVYGLGANALDPKAVKRIYAAKNRPSWDPIIAHVSDFDMMKILVKPQPAGLYDQLKRLMPGPLTVLLEKTGKVPSVLTPGTDKVSVRMPLHEIALQLIQASRLPIAAPSANLFGAVSPTTAKHVLEDLDGRIDAIIDAGPSSVGVESTVLDLTANPPVILRPGGTTKERLEEVFGKISVSGRNKKPEKSGALLSPGLLPRHYAPKARLVLVAASEKALQSAMARYGTSYRVGVMLPEGWKTDTAKADVFNWGPWGDWKRLAKNLYRGLRQLDSKNSRVILCPRPGTDGLGAALADRLTRASKK